MDPRCFPHYDHDSPTLGPGDELGPPCKDCGAITVYGWDEDSGLGLPQCDFEESEPCHECGWDHATAPCEGDDCGNFTCREHQKDGLCLECFAL